MQDLQHKLFNLLYGSLAFILVTATDFITLLGSGISSFAATNIDDIFFSKIFLQATPGALLHQCSST